jgi:hypothetical protein
LRLDKDHEQKAGSKILANENVASDPAKGDEASADFAENRSQQTNVGWNGRS